MKYNVDITVDAPIEHVAEKLNDRENQHKWQPGLEKIEHLDGEPGKAGSKARLHFIFRKKPMVMEELIEKNELPDEYSVFYDTNGVKNRVIMRLKPESNEKTRVITENEFMFSGAWKFFSLFMKGAFKKQSLQYLNLFKSFAESK